MRSQATRARESQRGSHALAGLLLASLACLALLLSAAPAHAATVTNQRPLLFSFDGSDTTAGPFTHPESVAVDYSTGDVYVLNTAGFGQGPGPSDSQRVIDKFDADAVAQPFSATGASSLDGSATPGGAFGVLGFFSEGSVNADLAVDNSGGATQGRIYVSEASGPIHAFGPDGGYLCTLPSSTVNPGGITVDTAGHLWVVDINQNKALEFDATGCPPAQIGSVALTAGNGLPRHPAIDQTGNVLYVADSAGSNSPSVNKYVAGIWDSILTTKPSRKITIDQSQAAGHLFTAHNDSFTEFAPVTNEQQTVTIGGGTFTPTSTFTLTFTDPSNTAATTAPIPFNASPADLQAALEGLSNIGAGNVLVTSPNPGGDPLNAGGPYTVTFRGTFAGIDVDHLTADPGGLTAVPGPATVTVATTQEGAGAAGAQVGSFGGDLIGDGSANGGGWGIAYNPSLDRVYVSDLASNTVKVFGPEASGTVPDVTTQTTDAVTRTAATAHGTINPLNLNNTYHFEWKQGTGASWGAAQSQPLPYPSITPTDSANHSVSFGLTGLKQNATYQVRLVGTGTDNGLSAYSAPDTFTTLAPDPPTVTIDPVQHDPTPPCTTGITTTSACVSGTIDPKEDITTWRVQTSTDSSCAAGFVDQPPQTISNPGPGPVAVTWDLTGLLPAQTYCVRLTATNAGGTTPSLPETFTTDAIPPTGVQTAFAAPRTDTTARINGRLNPQGPADVTYNFEWSTDAVNWTALPDRLSTIDARAPIVVADELTGLDPDTTYYYRLAAASNSAGPALTQGDPKTFTTRTTAEVTDPTPCPNQGVRATQHTDTYLPDCRGIELVNNPDKGNQNVLTGLGPITADGERAIWLVVAGAPGGNSGRGNVFLAKRTGPTGSAPNGWESKTLIPPAELQVGQGNYSYQPQSATPALSRFAFVARTEEKASLVRLDQDQNQDLLRNYPSLGVAQALVDLTDDGAHVVNVNPETRQLEDVGGGEPPDILSIMPGGTQSVCALSAEGESFFGRGSGSGAALTNWRPGYHRMATTDASRVYFEVRADGDCGSFAPYGLYLRNRETPKTTLIDLGSPGHDVELIRATPDGRSVYFATFSALDPADTNGHRDVYRWDEATGKSTCLTCEAAADANVNSGILVSDDFSHVYFSSQQALAPGASTSGTNIYTLAGGAIRFVGDVAGSALGDPELSADGNVLLFSAKPNPGLTADAVAPGVNTELYRYDDRDQSLECLSCRRGGETTHAGLGARLSADGSTVAFTTEEPLAPLDVNRGTDIYRWRDGSVRLITDGVSNFPDGVDASPQPVAVDADGSDIFFRLVQPDLTGFEQDGLANLYDARIGGGFTVPTPPPPCDGDSCQGPLQPPPPTDQPGSSGFSGPGNQGRDRTPAGTQTAKKCKKKHSKKCRKRSRSASADPRGSR